MKPHESKMPANDRASKKRADRLAARGAASEKLVTVKRQKIEDLARRVQTAEHLAELAERQARCISMELANARRRIAELESLIGVTR